MKFYNTLTRKVEDFSPLEDKTVKLYTCGPTVYDYAHIGNLRSFVFDDTLRRVLETGNFKVKHVMNITDVGHLVGDMDEGEDKLEAGANREGKSVWEVAEHYTESFKNDVAALNILPPNGYKGPRDSYARATDFIEEQIEIVKILLDKGFAYQTEEAIYFDVTKLPDYGELAGQKLSEKEVGVRSEVVTDQNKHHPQDFALWFFLVGRFKNHTMHWDSPWGAGFPGWHLECSAIIHKTLEDPIDIHTGGVDHIGTHHPNEMAQTEAAFGHKLANYWLHNEFVLADGQKMAKSLGNFYTLKNVVDRGYNPLALRLLFLQSHYRHQVNFSWENLQAAQNRLKAYQAMADLRWQFNEDGSLSHEEIEKSQKIIEHAMREDLDTPAALTELSLLEELAKDKLVSPGAEDKFYGFLQQIDNLLGLKLLPSTDIMPDQKQLVAEREKARDSKDWPKADELRSKLAEQGIEINDTPSGPIWYKN